MPYMNGQSDSEYTLSDTAGVRTDPPIEARYNTWGIFVIAYDTASAPLMFLPTSIALSEYHKPLQDFARFLTDLWSIAPWHSFKYYVYTLWFAFEPAFSLYLASLVIFKVEMPFQDREERKVIVNDVTVQLLWLLCGILNSYFEYEMLDLRAEIGGRLRAHFTPKLVQASLEWDMNQLNESSGRFPYPYDYGDFIPGWDFFELTFSRLRNIVAIILEVFCVMRIIFFLEDLVNTRILSTLTVLFLVTQSCTPKNCAGGGGYTYWSNNEHYKRLMVLFNITFDLQYRFTLVKDGLVDYFAEEYKTVSGLLGFVKADTNILSFNPPPPWYWVLPRDLMLKYPMALCALCLPLASSKSIIGIMAIFQLAVSRMRRPIEFLKTARTGNDFWSIFKRVQIFYEILDESPINHGSQDCVFNSEMQGCKITVRNVSYNYRLSKTPAVSNVNLTIERGQFIVIAGTNGSGKTSLMKLITGLIQPTAGEVFIDDVTLEPSAAKQFRKAVAFVTQSEEIYPVSLRENFLLGLASKGDRGSVKDTDINEAVRLGGAAHLIERCGYDAVLDPVTIPSESVEDRAGKAAVAARDRFSPNPVGTLFSMAERQRFIASRTFLRVIQGDIRLIILDEPFNALDPQAGFQVFEDLRKIARKNGQTLIVVTHHLTNVAHHSDMIFYMNDGEIKEQGTHGELIKARGPYSTFYNIQVTSRPI